MEENVSVGTNATNIARISKIVFLVGWLVLGLTVL